jgi:diguanylate cyclase
MHYTAMAGTRLSFSTEPELSASLISSDVLAIVVSIVAFSISGVFMLALIPREGQAISDDAKWNTRSTSPALLDAVEAEVFEKPTVPSLASVPDKSSNGLLPIEKNGNRFHIALADIVSVHANAHYTFIFNGREDLFCSLSISEVDERLEAAEFFRTHRSYIVNLKNVVRVKKAGDAAVAELDSSIRRAVPVSRTRVGQLREALLAFKAMDVAPTP